MPAQAQLATKPSLTLKRRLNAAPEKVFAAWTDPKKIVKWFGPDAGPVKEAEAVGTLGQSKPPVGEMFEDVFAQADWRVIEQRRELGA